MDIYTQSVTILPREACLQKKKLNIMSKLNGYAALESIKWVRFTYIIYWHVFAGACPLFRLQLSNYVINFITCIKFIYTLCTLYL